MDILTDFLDQYNDGRSKSFFCNSCALLPVDLLKETHNLILNQRDSTELKEMNKLLKDSLQTVAKNLETDLRLNNKK